MSKRRLTAIIVLALAVSVALTGILLMPVPAGSAGMHTDALGWMFAAAVGALLFAVLTAAFIAIEEDARREEKRWE